MKNTKKNNVAAAQAASASRKALGITEKVAKHFPLMFFAILWLLLAFFETEQLRRLQELSLFLPTETFFDEMMSAPAGLLSYIGCFLLQFFYYPAVGAAIYVALLYVVYLLVLKVFNLSSRWSLTALLSVAFLVASNMSQGYWHYYNKLQGYFYVAVVGTILVLLALWAFKKLPLWAKFIFVALWTIFAYPLFGAYALVATLFMGVQALCGKGNLVARLGLPLLSLALIAVVPAVAYNCFYTSTSFPLSYVAGIPAYQYSLANDWNFTKRVLLLWLPFVLLFVYVLLCAALSGRVVEKERTAKELAVSKAVVMGLVVLFTWAFWYTDNNFQIEIAQNRAMWTEDWERVAELAKKTDSPTRLIVVNKNIALLHLRRAGEEAFRYPDGSESPNSTMKVRIVQTGGKMAYYQYGRFNFCYRWCVEDAVEYGWKVEYLKHAIRSLTASGQYKTARRYVDILKRTLFHASWAEDYEKILDNPKLVDKTPELAFARQMFCYSNTLDVDDGFAEGYLLSHMTSNLYVDPTPYSTEASLMHALIRKDTQLFWNTFVAYLDNHKQMLRIPTHYQEALLLFAQIDKRADISKFKFDKKVDKRFRDFTSRISKYRGVKEADMAPHFKDDFGDTYWYFYFFVRELKSN